MYTNVNQLFVTIKKYRIAYFISISVFLLQERETGLEFSVLSHKMLTNPVK